MHCRISASVVAAFVFLAACSTDQVVSPISAPSSATLSNSVAQNGNSGRFLVLMTSDKIDPSFDQKVRDVGGRISRRHDEAGLALVSGLTPAAAAKLASAPGVSQVRRDIQISLNLPRKPVKVDAAALSRATSGQTNPANAILGSWQWNMRAIGADKAWAAGKLGSSTVTAAILDTGIDYDDPDLQGLVDLTRSTSFMSEYIPEADDAPIHLADDAVSKLYFPARHLISDYNGHGTNVAAQVSSNAHAFAGVTAKTRLIGVKVLGSNGVGSLGGVLSGVIWAANHGANVANMSLGGAFDRTGNEDVVDIINHVFDYAKRKRMLVVVAAGNESQDLDHFGTMYQTYCYAPHVVCVSAVGPTDAAGSPDIPSFFTNFGTNSIDVAAPGGNIDVSDFPPNLHFSDWPWGSDYGSWVWSYCAKTTIGDWTDKNEPILTACTSGHRLNGYIGTSQAAPHVTGLAALLVAVTGESKSMEIKGYIKQSAKDLGPPGPDAYYGAGRIDVWNAVRGQNNDGNGGSGKTPRKN